MPILDEIKLSRSFDETFDYIIGDPDNGESLSITLREDNPRNRTTAIILFEHIMLEIQNQSIRLDFYTKLSLPGNGHITAYALELILVPMAFLQEHNESDIAKEIISCWNHE